MGCSNACIERYSDMLVTLTTSNWQNLTALFEKVSTFTIVASFLKKVSAQKHFEETFFCF